jgi:hypothetical protein
MARNVLFTSALVTSIFLFGSHVRAQTYDQGQAVSAVACPGGANPCPADGKIYAKATGRLTVKFAVNVGHCIPITVIFYVDDQERNRHNFGYSATHDGLNVRDGEFVVEGIDLRDVKKDQEIQLRAQPDRPSPDLRACGAEPGKPLTLSSWGGWLNQMIKE